MRIPLWRWWHCHSQGRWLSGEAEYVTPAAQVLCDKSVYFSVCVVLGGAGAAAASGQSHSGILRERKDSEKRQLLPLREYLPVPSESVNLIAAYGETAFL